MRATSSSSGCLDEWFRFSPGPSGSPLRADRCVAPRTEQTRRIRRPGCCGRPQKGAPAAQTGGARRKRQQIAGESGSRGDQVALSVVDRPKQDLHRCAHRSLPGMVEPASRLGQDSTACVTRKLRERKKHVRGAARRLRARCEAKPPARRYAGYWSPGGRPRRRRWWPWCSCSPLRRRTGS